MPELPEVDRMVEILRPYCGWRIEDVSIFRGDKFLPGTEQNDLFGAVIREVFRRGKFIVWNTSNGILVGHNAMSGYWDTAEDPWTFDYVEGSREPTWNDVRVQMRIAPPVSAMAPDAFKRTLRYHDTRIFGSLRLYQNCACEAISSLKIGPEAISTKYTLPGIPVADHSTWQKIWKSKLPIKAAMMDQKLIAGLGNIYATEACFEAGIDPRRPANTLTEIEIDVLSVYSVIVLKAAIDRSLNYDSLSIYRRKKCVCGLPVLREDIKGRSTYFCSHCQK